VAIRAEKLNIATGIIAVITIYMVNLNGDLFGGGVDFAPTTFLAFWSQKMYQGCSCKSCCGDIFVL
jgi:hypothetical protein